MSLIDMFRNPIKDDKNEDKKSKEATYEELHWAVVRYLELRQAEEALIKLMKKNKSKRPEGFNIEINGKIYGVWYDPPYGRIECIEKEVIRERTETG